MYKTGKILACSMALLTLATTDTRAKRRAVPRAVPKAVLIQLFTNQRKIEYYGNKSKPVKINAEYNKVKEANQLITTDFNENFNALPIYYYYDTNAHLIQQHKFDGILLGKDLKPSKNISFPADDTTYYIAYWGKMVRDEEKGRMNDVPAWGAGNPVMSDISHLVVLTHDYRTLGRVKGKTRPVKRGTRKETERLNNLYKPAASRLNHFIGKTLN